MFLIIHRIIIGYFQITIEMVQVPSCKIQPDSTEISGMTSYQKSLEVDVGLTSSNVPAKFSASAGYQSVNEGTTKLPLLLCGDSWLNAQFTV